MIDSSEQASGPNAILVIDIDQSVTRAVLCDVVEGLARLVDVGEAVTTSGPPFYDASVGIGQAIRRLEEETGRRLTEGDAVLSPSRPDGDGIDRMFVTGSPVPANRVGLLSMGDASLTHVLRSAVRRTVSVLHEAEDYFTWTQTAFSPVAVEGWLRDARPSTVILIAAEATPEDWKATLDVVASVAPDVGARQGIIVGDEDRQQSAAEVLDETLELSGIDPAAYEHHEIASAVESELRDQYAASLQDEAALRMFSSGMFVDRVQSIENVAAFLHRRMERNLALLTSQDGTVLELASSGGALSIYRADLDINRAARSLLQIPSSSISRWVAFQMTEDEVRHWMLNRALRPQSAIYGANDQQIAAAATRELVSLTVSRGGVESDPDIELLVVGRELIDNLGNDVVMVALDSLKPLPADGVVILSADRDNIVASLGAISAGEPDYAREVIENDFLSPLASCVVLNGESQEGNRIAEIEIVTDTGDRREIVLSYGEIERFELPEGRTAEVTITPVQDISVGRYAAGERVTYDGDRAIHGGEWGIIFDGRGRPAHLPSESEARLTVLQNWRRVIAGERGQS